MQTPMQSRHSDETLLLQPEKQDSIDSDEYIAAQQYQAQPGIGRGYSELKRQEQP